MKLWVLRPAIGAEQWKSIYDKTFGHVIRAESESYARVEAAAHSGDEGPSVWLHDNTSTCEELLTEGKAEYIMQDFNAG